jgi:hypothetical protein
MTSLLRQSLLLLTLAAPLALASPAAAQDIAAAEALFNKGMADLQAGRFETACKAIAESQRLDPRPGTLFTLATCEARWGHVATAYTRYGDYLALYERLPDDRKAAQRERPQVAKAERDRMEREIPKLTLVLPKDAPAGTVVKRDGEVVSEAALGLALPVDPGTYTLTVTPPGGPASEERVTLAKGEKKTVTLTLAAAPKDLPPPPPPLPAEAPPKRSYLGPIIAFGAGAVALGVGAGTGAAVLSKRAALDKACQDKACPKSQESALNSAKTLSYVSTTSFVLGVAGAAVGTVLLVLPRRDKSKQVGVAVGPGHVALEGTF